MSIEQEAEKLVSKDRNQDYGNIHESFNRIAGLWSAYTGIKINSTDVGKMMILLKVSRAKYTNHHDSYVDIVGYVKCIEQLLNKDGNDMKFKGWKPIDIVITFIKSYEAGEITDYDVLEKIAGVLKEHGFMKETTKNLHKEDPMQWSSSLKYNTKNGINHGE